MIGNPNKTLYLGVLSTHLTAMTLTLSAAFHVAVQLLKVALVALVVLCSNVFSGFSDVRSLLMVCVCWSLAGINAMVIPGSCAARLQVCAVYPLRASGPIIAR